MTSELSERYLAEAGGDVLVAAFSLGLSLMEGEAASLKQGYSAANAALAAAELFSLDTPGQQRLDRLLRASAAALARAERGELVLAG